MALKRVLEPEVMDSPEEARDYDRMDHAHVNQMFVEDLLKFASQHSHTLQDVLDVGTGTALIPIELCKQNEECRVMAIDAAIAMLELGRHNLETHGLIDRVQLAHVDAKQMGYQDGMFDSVISNSIVHHIPEPKGCIAEMVRVTADDGLVFVRDLLRPENDAEVDRLVEEHAGNEEEQSRQMFDDSLRAALSLDEIRGLVAEFGFSPDTVQQTTDRHWTWAAIKPGA